MFPVAGFWAQGTKLLQKNKNVLCVVKLILTKTVQTKKKETQKAYKDQAFRQHVVQNQVSYASILKQASPLPPFNTCNFTADQIVSLVTSVVIQVAIPQTKNLPEKQVQANPICQNRSQKQLKNV